MPQVQNVLVWVNKYESLLVPALALLLQASVKMTQAEN